MKKRILILMKRLILILVTLAVGAVLGGVAGHFYTVVRWTLSEGKLSNVMDQKNVCEFGSNSFKAYLKEKPEVGIWALSYHLEELDRHQALWALWGKYSLITPKDVNWMRTVAHVRLANLYAKMGRADLSSNNLDVAWELCSQLNVRGITNRSGLISQIKEQDQTGRWW